MDTLIPLISNGTATQHMDAACTPDLQHSRYMSGESDNDSAHPTPSDMTPATQPSPQQAWPTTTTLAKTAKDEVRKIHYIDSLASDSSTVEPSMPADAKGASTPATVPSATLPSPSGDAAVRPQWQGTQVSQSISICPATPSTAVPVSTQAMTATSSATCGSSAAGSTNSVNSTTSQAIPSSHASEGTQSTAIAAPSIATTPAATPTEALPPRLTHTATSSAASTPASTPGATPQTFARKRGRPRKHPLPDPNTTTTKNKRKLSPDSTAAAAAKKKATAAAAARSAASNAAALLSVPDLGRLIPQGSTSDNAQTFIQNNVRLFADLFVALQKQALTDNAGCDAPQTSLQGVTQTDAEQPPAAGQTDASADKGDSLAVTTPPTYDASSAPLPSHADISAAAANIPSHPVSGPSDAIRDEVKKRMADITQGRQALQAEMLQMRVDASFFENAQKAVDERIAVLRDRIACNSLRLQQEREATRKAREASRRAKKDRKAKERSLRDSEKEERRLAQTFAQLEREIAAEEEERRRLEEAESTDEEAEQDIGDERHPIAAHQLLAIDQGVFAATPSEATSTSAAATPSLTDTAMTPDRTIGFSDEELAKVLGISTSELAGFSQTLDLAPLPTPLPSTETSQSQAADSNDNFDVAAFLELASSFGTEAAGQQQ